MKDRVPKYPGRVKMTRADGSVEYVTLTRADEPQVPGTPLSKATFLSDATAAKLWASPTGEETVDGALALLQNGVEKSLIRDLNFMLTESLGTNNFDAWCDFLKSNSGFDTGKSSGYVIGNDGLACKTESTRIGVTNNGGHAFGRADSPQKLGQTFVAANTGLLASLSSYMGKTNSPTDSVRMRLYKEDKTTLIAQSDAVTVGSSNPAVFPFPHPKLTAGTAYFLSLERTGSLSNTNYYSADRFSSGGDTTLNVYTYQNGAWSKSTNGSIIYNLTLVNDAVVVWKPVSASKALSSIAVCVNAVLNGGTISFYVSSNGTSWTKLSALRTAQQYRFTGTSVYLKCIVTKNAKMQAVAWGGY